eukprot:TRINITY_DN10153_c0_g1_i2.p1 TRINITY_DN10153_c0_g1~~TRINITY_DN10153_c0_g1_i2.p1  ORF type:complete len:124 (-),score=14.17 TRINITY_DN10153_c0_g1_i2:40-411(-)
MVQSRLLTVASRSLSNGAGIAFLKARNLRKTAHSPPSRSSLSRDENNPYLSLLFRLSLPLSLLLLSTVSHKWMAPISFSFQVSLFLSHSLSPSRALSLSPNRLQGISKLQLSSECNLAFSQTL